MSQDLEQGNASAAEALARHYFALSNAGNLAEIRKLFTDSSTYSSANTGVYLGVDEIMAMQTVFFDKFESMSWEIHRVDEVRAGVVHFEFTFNAKTRDGENVVLPGEEYVIVYDGKLQHVEVRNKI